MRSGAVVICHEWSDERIKNPKRLSSEGMNESLCDLLQFGEADGGGDAQQRRSRSSLLHVCPHAICGEETLTQHFLPPWTESLPEGCVVY